ncbi:hydrolase 76 protein [Lodderomyces elongisporus]|uniref:hydrolase 76 protein n=1 Tax=Lodderomyces elongisporus TaxID=36914 RepID=UPI00291DFAE3|nr:hydrolase 76 protein [Lodderomyces elongisporus]WLF77400.1 hydrolase 76 protein [Lodderomyces elongisporus]
MKSRSVSCFITFCFLTLTQAIWLDTNNDTTIREDCALIADGILDYYDGYNYGGTIGEFVAPYYWWEAGGAWGSLIDYTFFFENDTYVPLIKQALLYQVGDDNNYIPLNQSTTEGNDDQGFWGIAVMGAAERNFSNPDSDEISWLGLAQAVFNTMTARWDSADCNGGLRWQIFQWNSGYDYKNSVSNGCLFHLAARLARFTGNDSYVEWAERVWNWMYGAGLLTEGNEWFVYDGVKIANNCSNITKYQWTYNQGLMLAGCAYLYNYTEEEKWLNYTKNLLHSSRVFFMNKTGSMVMYEAACQPGYTCNNDQRSFKAYFSRFLGLTSVLVPETEPTINKWLVDSANGAAGSCSGGSDGHTCGLSWTNWTVGWDGLYGLGEQMSALEVMQNLMSTKRPAPYTANDGGSSKSHPASGYGTTKANAQPLSLDGGDKAGAGIITAVIGISIIGCGVWLIL